MRNVSTGPTREIAVIRRLGVVQFGTLSVDQTTVLPVSLCLSLSVSLCAVCLCAGKSTLLSVLFSLGPLKSGAVSIGGTDLAGISCHAVRSNLAIVPQSPTLFDGVSAPHSVVVCCAFKVA